MISLIQFLPIWMFYIPLLIGIGGIGFSFLIPFVYKIPAKIISLLLIIIGSYLIGFSSASEDWKKEIELQNKEIERLNSLSEQVTERIVTEYVDKVVYVKQKGKDIVKQIPVYITKENDDNCIINNGFVQLHDDAAKNQVSNTSSIINAEASDIKLSKVGETVAENYNKYHQLETQLELLQQWIIEQGRVYNAD